MAHIFISYSKQCPEHTKALAADLQARGHATWWDTSLLPGDDFPDLIERKIDKAKAVIVIWTPALTGTSFCGSCTKWPKMAPGSPR